MVFLQATNTQARVTPQVQDEICQECRKCPARQVCPTKALVQIDLGEAPMVDPSRCYGCHKCMSACPFGAIAV